MHKGNAKNSLRCLSAPHDTRFLNRSFLARRYSSKGEQVVVGVKPLRPFSFEGRFGATTASRAPLSYIEMHALRGTRFLEGNRDGHVVSHGPPNRNVAMIDTLFSPSHAV